MAKYLEKKAESLEKLNDNLASETARTTLSELRWIYDSA